MMENDQLVLAYPYPLFKNYFISKIQAKKNQFSMSYTEMFGLQNDIN
jgi:hypothetical protein